MIHFDTPFVVDVLRESSRPLRGTSKSTRALAAELAAEHHPVSHEKVVLKVQTLLITADGGGSNGYRLRQWKMELQALADGAALSIMVCHFPPGTSKWNKVEHRLFSFISSNWRGEPLRGYETIVRLIAKTTTAKGLKVRCRLGRHSYPVGRKVSDQEIATLNLTPHSFHGEWNDLIRPHDM